VAEIARRLPAGRVRVGIDGRDGAGKTEFGDELGTALTALGRPVLRASGDGFHRPRAERYRRGRDSGLGYWLDAFDLSRFAGDLLVPFAAGEPVRTAVRDVRTDAALDLAPVLPAPGTVLVVDGMFLHRDELAAYWEFSVYLHVDLAVSLARLHARDGPPPTATDRYAEAQRIYAAACDPAARATLRLDNSDLAAPRVITPAE
jgi:uridine kinase